MFGDGGVLDLLALDVDVVGVHGKDVPAVPVQPGCSEDGGYSSVVAGVSPEHLSVEEGGVADLEE